MTLLGKKVEHGPNCKNKYCILKIFVLLNILTLENTKWFFLKIIKEQSLQKLKASQTLLFVIKSNKIKVRLGIKQQIYIKHKIRHGMIDELIALNHLTFIFPNI